MNENTQVQEQVEEQVVEMISKLDGKLSMKAINDKLNEIIDYINENHSHRKTRDSGPKSTRKLDDDLARAVLFGEDRELTVKEVCEKHGLSYGQVYSLREGYTFKTVQKEYEEWKEEQRAK